MIRRLNLPAITALVAVAALAVAAAPLAGGQAPVSVPVAAVGFQFAPFAVVVPAGGEVAWQGVTLVHTVTTADSAEDMIAGNANDARNEDADPDSFNRLLYQGGEVTHTFETPGTYYYYCEPHVAMGMWGIVQVV